MDRGSFFGITDLTDDTDFHGFFSIITDLSDDTEKICVHLSNPFHPCFQKVIRCTPGKNPCISVKSVSSVILKQSVQIRY